MRLGRFAISGGHKPDYFFLGIVFLLLIIGFLVLSSASSDIGKIRFNDPFHFIKDQILKGLLPGLVGFLFGYFFYYRNWRKLAAVMFFVNLILLILVFTPLGYSSHGSFRWLELGPLSFQPSELLKITFIVYLAALFSGATVKNMKKGWRTYWIFMAVSALVAGLIFIQPATTMAVIIIGSGAAMYFMYGASWKHLLLTLAIGIVGVAVLSQITPYRMRRVAPFWNPIAQNISQSLVIDGVVSDDFHIKQAKQSIGTGKIWGVGFGKSTSKYSVLPEPMGDSIFAVIAEEFGFAGSLFIIFLYALFLWRGTSLVLRSHDDFARLLMIGFVSVISIQSIIHIAANTGLAPLTGVPLPFISYGGTALAVTLTMVGIIANVSRNASAR